MTATMRPTSPAQVVDAVCQALADGTPLAVVGAGTKRGLGRPVQAAGTLDLSGLAGILSYEPAELVLTCLAGTPMAEIDAALRQHGQALAFEPADLGLLYAAAAAAGTIGGALACNLSGPRRLKAGAARDHFLGFKAVSGRGEPFQAGGKVVKNVTGYDLPKLLAGSHGTLAALTEVSIKVLPVPEKARTVLVFGLDDAAAMRAMAAALAGAHEVSAAAHLPAAVAARTMIEHVTKPGAAVTALRLEGPLESVRYRCAALRAELAAVGAGDEMHSMRSAVFWREVRDVARLLPGDPRILWRLSVPPASGAAVVGEINARLAGDDSPFSVEERGGARGVPEYFFDWAGGLVWFALPPRDDAGAAIVRAAVASHGGGHATLMRAGDATRLAVPVFEPEPAALAALSRRVKEAFDPRRLLNPGRMSAHV